MQNACDSDSRCGLACDAGAPRCQIASDVGRAMRTTKKRHIDINFLVWLLLGHPGNVPGTNRVCPRDKPRFSSYFTQRKPSLSLGQTHVFFLFYTAEAQFVPGTFRGRRAADRVYVLRVYVPFSFPSYLQRQSDMHVWCELHIYINIYYSNSVRTKWGFL